MTTKPTTFVGARVCTTDDEIKAALVEALAIVAARNERRDAIAKAWAEARYVLEDGKVQ
jgi:hypothetical protein